MISAGLAALTVLAVVDCLATLGITMTSLPDRGYAISEHPISWEGYDRFLGDDFFQDSSGQKGLKYGAHGSVLYDERGWPFPVSFAGADRVDLPAQTRKVLDPVHAWPHLVVMSNAQTEETVEWVPSVSSLSDVERVGSAYAAWHHAVFFSAWLGWKVQKQTGARVYFRLPTWAERGHPLRTRLGLSEGDRLVESFGDRAPSRDDIGSTLDRWPREHEWLIDGQNVSGTELLPGYRLVFSASEFMSDRIHRIDAVASQSQVWEDVGTFRVAVSRNSLPPLAVIP